MVSIEQLLEAGVHFGHLSRKWNPQMAPYIFMPPRNDIHIIDLIKTQRLLQEASLVAKQLAKADKTIMFVGTKKQAKDILATHAREVNMPYATERWLGGMLTNFQTVRKSIKRMQQIEKMFSDGSAQLLQKKERLMLEREREKLDRVLGGMADMTRMPGALFIVDITREHIALAEAKKLNIPTLGLVDTNSNPLLVDFPIPGNDDAAKSIDLITRTITDAIKEGLEERRNERPTEGDDTTQQEAVSVEAPSGGEE